MSWMRLIICCLLVSALGASALESETPSTISPEVVLKAVSILEQDPLGEKIDLAMKAIILFTTESDDVMVTLSEEVTPWINRKPKLEYDHLLFTAFVAGNIKEQLVNGICEDQRAAGISQVIATYQYLRQHTKIEPIEEIEAWISEEENSRDSAWIRRLMTGREVMFSGEPLEAIVEHYNPVIDHYETAYKDETRTIYCAATQAESLAYLAMAEVDADPSHSNTNGAVVLEHVWAEAYFLKAYALVELRQTDAAKAELKKALKLSPRHAQYWAELGHILQLEKEWDQCLEAYNKVAESAQVSTPEYKNGDLARAWRGIGFVLVEQGKLDEAEAQYRKCLELDPNDNKARAELNYIQGLREKKR